MALARKCGGVFRELLGPENVKVRQPVMGAEDFGRYAEGKMPIFMYFLGTIYEGEVRGSPEARRTPLPGMHTDTYAPIPEPSIRTGVRTMSLAAMNLMPKEKEVTNRIIDYRYRDDPDRLQFTSDQPGRGDR